MKLKKENSFINLFGTTEGIKPGQREPIPWCGFTQTSCPQGKRLLVPRSRGGTPTGAVKEPAQSCSTATAGQQEDDHVSVALRGVPQAVSLVGSQVALLRRLEGL